MSTYTIRTPLKRDGKRLEAGDTVELDKKDAAPLLAAGAIDEHSKKGSDPAPGAEQPAGESAQGGDDPAAGPAAAEEFSDGKVNVNTASASAIALAAKGIGKKTAADIVAHRNEKGLFAKLDDLTAVGGISQAIVDDNRDVLTV